MVRMEEMRQSNEIVRQAMDNLPGGKFLADVPGVTLPPIEEVLSNKEARKRHFLFIAKGIRPPCW